MFIGHLNIITSVPISAIATHNQTSHNSPDKFSSSEPICKIWENLHLRKITRYMVLARKNLVNKLQSVHMPNTHDFDVSVNIGQENFGK